MGLFEIVMIAVGLSMDAFAVAICKGLATKEFSMQNMFKVGIWFGAFQALMPAIGYLLGSRFKEYIEKFDHWIAFALLFIIGFNMIRESRESEEVNDDMSAKTMLVLAIATSIDALAVGVSFAICGLENIPYVLILIGATTFLISSIGFFVGNRFGGKYKSKSELAGGVILILMAFKILFEHLNIL